MTKPIHFVSQSVSVLGTDRQISDAKLDDLVRDAQIRYSNIGIRMIKGLLHGNGQCPERKDTSVTSSKRPHGSNSEVGRSNEMAAVQCALPTCSMAY